MEKKCSKCERAFTCQNEQRGCWCENIRLSREVLNDLRKKYQNCLCPACLAEFSVGNTNPLLNENQ
jgi:hypothetical protein